MTKIRKEQIETSGGNSGDTIEIDGSSFVFSPNTGDGYGGGENLGETLALGNETDGYFIFFENVASPPGGTPTGGAYWYVENGASKAKGSSGTVTTFGPAEPHCPRCGRDFALESENKTEGWHISICIPCLIGSLNKAGISMDEYIIDKKGL